MNSDDGDDKRMLAPTGRFASRAHWNWTRTGTFGFKDAPCRFFCLTEQKPSICPRPQVSGMYIHGIYTARLFVGNDTVSSIVGAYHVLLHSNTDASQLQSRFPTNRWLANLSYGDVAARSITGHACPRTHRRSVPIRVPQQNMTAVG